MRADRMVRIAVAASGAVAALVIAVRIDALGNATYRFGDAAGLPLLGQAMAQGQGPIFLPTQTSIGPLWIDALTAHMPGHRTLWFFLGPLMALLAIGFLIDGARRLFSWNALVAAAIALAMPPVILWTILFQDNHVTTVLGTSLLGWHLTVVLTRPVRRRSYALAVAVGLMTGICVVSDPQLVASGVAPYVVGIIAMRIQQARLTPSLIPPVVALAVTPVAAYGVRGLMRATNVELLDIFSPRPSLDAISRGLNLGAHGFVWMGNGDWYGAEIGAWSVVGILAAAAAIITPIVALLRRWVQRPSADDDAGLHPARAVYTAYWACAMGLLIAAFLLAGYSFEALQAHYLSGCFFCVAALAPAAMGGRGWRALIVPVVALAFVLRSTIGVATVDARLFSTPVIRSDSADLPAVLLAHGLHHGYAGYWDAFDLTWRGREALDVWPILEGKDCEGKKPGSLCAYGLPSAGGHYRAVPGRSFVVVRHDRFGCVNIEPDRALTGAPLEVIRQGGYDIEVYDHDVVSNFVARDNLLCT